MTSREPDERLRGATEAPGGQAARRRGCRCSVLANAAFRAGAPGEQPFVDPDCAVHGGGRPDPHGVGP